MSIYLNEFDNIIIDVINNKKITNPFKTSEHIGESNKIIDKYSNIASVILRKKNIDNKENFAEYNRAINIIKDNKQPSKLAVALKISDKNIDSILWFYENNDRSKIVRIINEELFAKAKKITQQVYYPKNTTVDMISIEEMFKDDIKSSTIFYNIIKDSNTFVSKDDDKIVRLLNSQIVIPICNDFMWIDNVNEIYPVNKSIKVKKESQEKLFYIVNKINEVKMKLEAGDNSILPANLKYKNGFYFSFNENQKIIEDNLYTSDYLIKQNVDVLLDHKQDSYFNLTSSHYFNYYFTGNLTALRYVSISEQDDKFINKNMKVQIRTSANSSINIVGYCVISGKDLDDIKYGDIKQTTYNDFIDKVGKKINGDSYSNIYCWIFDDNDKKRLVNYGDDNSVICKQLTEQLFDDINTIHNEYIKKKTSECNNYHELMSFIEHEIDRFNMPYGQDASIVPINDYHYGFKEEKMKQLNQTIYEFLMKHNKELDDKFNNLYGHEDAIKLKAPVLAIPKRKVKLDLTNEKYLQDQLIDKYKGLTCQHYITWNNINKLYNTKKSDYQTLLNNFVSKFITIDVHGKYVCKSCGESVNIETYANELSKSGDKLIVVSSISIGRIEDDPKYKEYKGIDGVINGVKNNVIKISEITNIPEYAIRSGKSENEINQLTKNIIDMLNNTMSLWNKQYDKYNETKEQKYGIINVLSELFFWNFDNNLYNNNTQFRDINKIQKQNNAILYASIIIINSLSRDQIINLNKTKDCNYDKYETFVKFIKDCQIQITSDQITPITHYPVLAYTIFNFAYNLVKYNRFIDVKGRAKDNKLTAELIIKAFYTMCDLFNVFNLTFLTMNLDVNSDIYNFYQRYYLNFKTHLTDIYSDSSFISSLRYDPTKQTDKTVLSKDKYKLSGTIEDYYGNIIINNSIRKYFNKFDNAVRNNYHKTNKLFYNELKNTNVFNCQDGRMHNWINDNKDIKCSKCGLIYSDVIKKHDSGLLDKSINIFLQKLATIYCVSGNKHNFIIKNDKRICSNCNYVDGSELSVSKLKELQSNLFTTELIKDNVNEKKSITIIDDIKILNAEFDKLKKELVKDYTRIDEDGVVVNIDELTYEFNYDYKGQPLSEPIIVKEKDIKETEINGKPVIYYRDGDKNLFYSGNKFIGYSIGNKEMIEYKGTIIYLCKINKDIKTFINELFIPKNVINIMFTSKKHVIDTYYNNFASFMNNLVKVVNKINKDDDVVVKYNKNNTIDAYISNRHNMLNVIAKTYNGVKRDFTIDAKFAEILLLAYDSLIEYADDEVEIYEETFSIFKQYNFFSFVIFSQIILLKAINSLIATDRKIMKVIVKLLVSFYNDNNINEPELIQFIDSIYDTKMSYEYVSDSELTNETTSDESDDDEKGIEEGLDIDEFKDSNDDEDDD